jgi:SnoaL-like protein
MAELAQIQQLLGKYCWAHDSRDTELLATCFAKDIEFMGAVGRDAVVGVFRAGYAHLEAKRRHVITNTWIVENGDEEAVVQSYITLYLIRDDHLELHLTGVYRDTVVLEDGEWRIKARDAAMDVPYNPGDAPAAMAGKRG